MLILHLNQLNLLNMVYFFQLRNDNPVAFLIFSKHTLISQSFASVWKACMQEVAVPNEKQKNLFQYQQAVPERLFDQQP